MRAQYVRICYLSVQIVIATYLSYNDIDICVIEVYTSKATCRGNTYRMKLFGQLRNRHLWYNKLLYNYSCPYVTLKCHEDQCPIDNFGHLVSLPAGMMHWKHFLTRTLKSVVPSKSQQNPTS